MCVCVWGGGVILPKRYDTPVASFPGFSLRTSGARIKWGKPGNEANTSVLQITDVSVCVDASGCDVIPCLHSGVQLYKGVPGYGSGHACWVSSIGSLTPGTGLYR